MSIRVRFAPSPTGALHIGGIRTALYNFLLARKMGGTFILRIEDTDRLRYVPGGEKYIVDALEWSGLSPDEGPNQGGDFGPYRQSERLHLYGQYAEQLLASGWAYYAFDTAEQLDEMREQAKAENRTFQYDSKSRGQFNNSLRLSAEETKALLDAGAPYAVRFKMPENEVVMANDLVRGEVQFNTSELDDKVLMKSDGWPTYHLANVVDDHLMQITHVIRGEEWLPSVGLHIMLYKAFGWLDTMPRFAHLPLILKPEGSGKLSKRDGAKFGFPVYPIRWEGDSAEETFDGFREYGFEPEAMINFMGLLGWNPGTEQEIFLMPEMIERFEIEKIHKSGARFDFEKAKWYNQQHIWQMDEAKLNAKVGAALLTHGHNVDAETIDAFVLLFRERVHFVHEFWEKGYYCFEPIRTYDMTTVQSKWKPERKDLMLQLPDIWHALPTWAAFDIEAATKGWMAENGLKPGEVLPILRLALCGNMQGPAVFDMLAFLGPDVAKQRIAAAMEAWG